MSAGGDPVPTSHSSPSIPVPSLSPLPLLSFPLPFLPPLYVGKAAPLKLSMDLREGSAVSFFSWVRGIVVTFCCIVCSQNASGCSINVCVCFII